MSRGRPRHQASRRRTYSTRQRDVRERQWHALEPELRTAKGSDGIEPAERDDFESPVSWQLSLAGGASAA